MNNVWTVYEEIIDKHPKTKQYFEEIWTFQKLISTLVILNTKLSTNKSMMSSWLYCKKNNLQQLVKSPTHLLDYTLDLIRTNSSELVKDIVSVRPAQTNRTLNAAKGNYTSQASQSRKPYWIYVEDIK